MLTLPLSPVAIESWGISTSQRLATQPCVRFSSKLCRTSSLNLRSSPPGSRGGSRWQQDEAADFASAAQWSAQERRNIVMFFTPTSQRADGSFSAVSARRGVHGSVAASFEDA
ncbi:unnamed protein product [Prorocentrum cordatum]|uniref:Uncharacterized protein n=1 Tax=Prorocentrum cordatum TaxID=2364126 RepID=A0ABN9QWM6_9DINO|nr:unnamed protein product [Polarella glacialis]